MFDFQRITINTSGGIPIYMQLSNAIKELIVSGQLQEGDKLPPASEFIRELGISAITVNNGIKELVEEQLVFRRPRLGTFVKGEGATPSTISVSTPAKRKKYLRVNIWNMGTVDHYWGTVLSTLQDQCRSYGFELLLSDKVLFDNDDIDVSEIVNGVDAVILCGFNSKAVAEEIRRHKIPVVLIGDLATEEAFDNIDIIGHDEIQRAYISTKHLLDLNHRRITCMVAPEGSRLAKDHMDGYKKAMAEYNNSENNCFEICEYHSLDLGREKGLQMLARANRPSAIFANDDFLAVGVIQAAKQLGLAVPLELSVIGVADRDIAKVITPSLTTSLTSPDQSAKLAMSQLMDQIAEGEKHEFARTQIPINELIIRESTCFNKINQNVQEGSPNELQMA